MLRRGRELFCCRSLHDPAAPHSGAVRLREMPAWWASVPLRTVVLKFAGKYNFRYSLIILTRRVLPDRSHVLRSGNMTQQNTI